MAMDRQQCGNCGEPLTPRGGLAPRFCPRCGRGLSPLADRSGERAVWRPQRVSGAAVASLVVGIIGLFTPCAAVGLVAILLGAAARAGIKQSQGTRTGGGLAMAGIVLGIIGSALWLAVCPAAL